MTYNETKVNKAISFWHFIQEHTVEIPIIQRDYAQGRLGEEYLRYNFLINLKQALDDYLPNEKKVLILDFVYGSQNKDNPKSYPLDGQQRLTTLWLFHWYIALKAGNLEKACDTLKKFSYETRISSREFCQELCNYSHFQNYDDSESIVDFITSRTWFYSFWKQDPTIQAMLRMIGGTRICNKYDIDIVDGLEELFQETSSEKFKCYWEALTSDAAPIVFYYLPLENFGLTDDLYVKMNARGKQLSSFENFKADFIGHIKEQAKECDGRDCSEWNTLLDPKQGIPIRLDTTWLDIFWKHPANNEEFDKSYFAFFNRYFLNCAIIYYDEPEKLGIWKLYGEKSDDSSLSYDNGFHIYSSILEDRGLAILCNIKKLFDNLTKIENVNEYLPRWFKKFDFIPTYNGESISTLTQPQRVAFFGICKYLESCSDFNETHFKRWMRVVCNLVENTTIDTVDAMIGRIKLINELSTYIANIYEYLSSDEIEIQSKASPEQLGEEIEKAKQILKPQEAKLPEKPNDWDEDKEWNWETAIIEAENFAFFKGAIRFLFKDVNSNNDWTYFAIKFSNSKLIFNSDGLTSGYTKCAKANRIILSYCDQWLQQIESYTHHNKYIFGLSSQLWKDNILLKRGIEDNSLLYANAIHHLLLGDSINTLLQLKDPDKYRNIAFEKLVNTNIIEWGQNQKNPDKYYVRWTYDGLCLYPSSEGVILTMPKRDFLLNSLLSDNIITLVNGKELDIIPQKMFWGWNIKFQYVKYGMQYLFQWQHWNWIDMYDGDKRLYEDESLKSYELTFNGDDIKDEADLIEKMDQCIARYLNAKRNANQPL